MLMLPLYNFSSFSLAMAMGMLLQGTSGDTEKEIGATIFKGLQVSRLLNFLQP
jgi:serine protease inhibitor